jgi:uncharacterized repeat protein (TIGR03806 family)
LLAAGSLAAGLFACGGRDTPLGPGPDAGGDAAAPGVPFGLEQRPGNPDCLAPARPPAGGEVALERVFPALTFDMPVLLLQEPGRSDRFYVVEKRGRIRLIENGVMSTFADLTDRVASGDYAYETGLLGMAFDPAFARSGRVYLSYTRWEPGHLTSTLSRFHSSDGGRTLDTGSPGHEQRILNVVQPPAGNHKGGHIQFGPDGHLYIGFGDGGGGGDTYGNGQNPATLLAKILRLDVSTSDASYRVPPDNPFVAGGNPPEAWAVGFRNPWRWSIDPLTGDLWAGDVGQNSREEIDLVRRGGNYGWSVREGAACYPPDSICDATGFIDPVVDYGRDQGNSVTGGHVYRGQAIPGLAGRYVYGDFGSGRIFGLFADADGRPEGRLLLSSGKNISSFGLGNDGELYILHYAENSGAVFKLVPAGPVAPDRFPRTLSATGCMDPADPSRPGRGLIPYDVNAPLWSDGADKERWMALPDGSQIEVDDGGDLVLPAGSVLIKQFRIHGRPIETRLLVHHEDGDWAGYSYEWDEAGRDATLLAGARRVTRGGLSWLYPGREDCLRCHTRAAGRTLGLELGQLNRTLDYGAGRVAPQLATLAHIGLFDGPLPAVLPLIPGVQHDASNEQRARALLHANCSPCHRAGGPGGGTADYRYGLGLAETKLCDVAPLFGDLGVADARLLAPGAPGRSLVLLRMQSLGLARMPPLASSAVDAYAMATLQAWITGLGACP